MTTAPPTPRRCFPAATCLLLAVSSRNCPAAANSRRRDCKRNRRDEFSFRPGKGKFASRESMPDRNAMVRRKCPAVVPNGAVVPARPRPQPKRHVESSLLRWRRSYLERGSLPGGPGASADRSEWNRKEPRPITVSRTGGSAPPAHETTLGKGLLAAWREALEDADDLRRLGSLLAIAQRAPPTELRLLLDWVSRVTLVSRNV